MYGETSDEISNWRNVSQCAAANCRHVSTSTRYDSLWPSCLLLPAEPSAQQSWLAHGPASTCPVRRRLGRSSAVAELGSVSSNSHLVKSSIQAFFVLFAAASLLACSKKPQLNPLPKLAWPPLSEFAAVSGRPATTEDVSAGRAAFVLQEAGRSIGEPIDISVPQYAILRDV